jgi:hypothetical protein
VEVGRTYRERANERQAEHLRRNLTLSGAVRRLSARQACDPTFDVFDADLDASKPGNSHAFLWGNRRVDGGAPCLPVVTAGYIIGVGRHRAKLSLRCDRR